MYIKSNTVARSCDVYTSSATLTAYTILLRQSFYGDLVSLATIKSTDFLKCLTFLCDCNEIWIFWTNFNESLQCMKIHQVGVELIHANKQVSTRTTTTQLKALLATIRTHLKIRACENIVCRKVSELLSIAVSDVRFSTKQSLERNKDIKMFSQKLLSIHHTDFEQNRSNSLCAVTSGLDVMK
jgi:hypothetical protein